MCQGAEAAASFDKLRMSGLKDEESPGSTKQRGRVTPAGCLPHGRHSGKVPQRVYRRWTLKVTGKGERVRQERTGALATASAWQTPPGARPNRGLASAFGRAVAFRRERPGLAARAIRQRVA